jgi:hypothetical protein
LRGDSIIGATIRSGSGSGIDTASEVGSRFGALLTRVGLGIIEVAEMISFTIYKDAAYKYYRENIDVPLN